MTHPARDEKPPASPPPPASPAWLTVAALLGALAGAVGAPYLIDCVLGLQTRGMRGALFAGFIATFAMGYFLWLSYARFVLASAVESVVRGMLWRFLQSLFRSLTGPNRAAPSTRLAEAVPQAAQEALVAAKDALPGFMAELPDLAGKILRAGRVFFWVALPTAMLVGLVGALCGEAWWKAVVSAALCALFGWALAWLARRGFLPVALEE